MLLEQIRAFAHESGIPKSLWGEAVRRASWLKNRTATRARWQDPIRGVAPPAPRPHQSANMGPPCVGAQPRQIETGSACQCKGGRDGRGWPGFDVNVRAHCVFWSGLSSSSKVNIERDVYFRTSVQLEGEEEGLDIPSGSSKLPADPKTPPPKEPPQEQATHHATHASHTAPDSAKISQPMLHRFSRLRKPSCPVCELLSGGPYDGPYPPRGKRNTKWSKRSDPGARGSHGDVLAAQAALALTKGTTGLRLAGTTEVVIDHAEN